MASKYKDLIGKYNLIREYMREFFVYGFKCCGEIGEKSERTYSDRLYNVQCWLEGYMDFKQSTTGRAHFISVDSREVVHNPLFKSLKSNVFNTSDILLHFCLLDMLTENEEMSISDITDRVHSEYFDAMNCDILMEEKTIRKKLQEYAELGILSKKTGIRNKQFYSLAINRLDLISWFDAICFFSETNPLGVIGSFLLDNKMLDEKASNFWFKHHYMLYAMDSEIVEKVLLSINEKKYIGIKTIGKKKRDNNKIVFPIKLYVSTQNGREYLLCHDVTGTGINFVRLDNIKEITIKGKCDDYQMYENEYDASKPYLWGVISGKAKDIAHVEMTIRIGENEEFIIERLEREKRNGHVYKINDQKYKYVVDTYDAMELMPWIRTFIGRIENLESTNEFLKKKFDEDMKLMYAMYLGGEDSAI